MLFAASNYDYPFFVIWRMPRFANKLFMHFFKIAMFVHMHFFKIAMFVRYLSNAHEYGVMYN